MLICYNNLVTKSKRKVSFGKEERITNPKIHELVFKFVHHSPHAPYLAPSDYNLFPNMEKWLAGTRVSLNSKVFAAVNSYFEDLDSSTCNEGIANLHYRWNKCVE